ncbi:hypothetical protein [Micromonospora sediminimaris]|uniref:Uncharacterized protein n=1 Tax=Micromonospora sediminimaris TaxID=547162 RepID=A0A9W5UPH7_9ACTN|nr:hypothetical protein [Micromonospora sediminimaris]GIJ31841.1 hypothetical protein Vse01_09890 [Micromonospora sediminimaris]SFB88336.1 hypothetical protein SAMN05216284_101474 [Micromonospora sediminimaris]
MSTFDEYAALARHLAVQHRAGEQGAAAEAERQRDLGAAVEYLDRRLTAQGQRLDHLGRTIGIAPGGPSGTAPTGATPGGAVPGGPPPGPPPPGAPMSGPPAPPGAPVSGPAGPSPTGAPVSGPPGRPPGSPGYPGGGWGPGTGSDGGAAAAPGRPDVGAYSPVGVGQTGPALPVAVSATAAGVPAPRAGAVDPATELELARRWADEADRHGQQAELLAQQPALLPGWSSRARAVAVYAGAAGIAALLLLVLTFGWSLGVVGLGTLLAWMLAGLPAMALIGGWLVLGRWGRPAVGAATPPRHPVLGFLICFLAVPLAYCGYLLLFRVLR